MSDLTDCRLPATIARLARRADSLPPADAMAELSGAQLAMWLAVREQNVTDSRGLIPQICSQGAGRDALRDLVELGHLEHYREGPNSYIRYWDPDTTDTPEFDELNYTKPVDEPITDGRQAQYRERNAVRTSGGER